jgi:hypothetical protein
VYIIFLVKATGSAGNETILYIIKHECIMHDRLAVYYILYTAQLRCTQIMDLALALVLSCKVMIENQKQIKEEEEEEEEEEGKIKKRESELG